MERSTVGTKKQSPDGLTVTQAYHPPGVAATPNVGLVDDLPNEPTYTYNPSTTPWEVRIIYDTVSKMTHRLRNKKIRNI